MSRADTLAADIRTIIQELRKGREPIRPQALASLLELMLDMHIRRVDGPGVAPGPAGGACV